MAGFENTLSMVSQAVLNRDLTENEKIEFLRLGSALGMSNVQDFLYMLMIFKRNEDKVTEALVSFQNQISERFDEMSVLENKLDAKLENSIERILGEGAREIGRDIGERIGYEARKTLTTHDKYHFTRGQIMIVGFMAILAVIAYGFGVAFGDLDNAIHDPVRILLSIPSGYPILLCAMAYSLIWSLDCWWQIESKWAYKLRFVLQILVLIALLMYLI